MVLRALPLSLIASMPLLVVLWPTTPTPSVLLAVTATPMDVAAMAEPVPSLVIARASLALTIVLSQGSGIPQSAMSQLPCPLVDMLLVQCAVRASRHYPAAGRGAAPRRRRSPWLPHPTEVNDGQSRAVRPVGQREFARRGMAWRVNQERVNTGDGT